jgi:hypothetical protein
VYLWSCIGIANNEAAAATYHLLNCPLQQPCKTRAMKELTKALEKLLADAEDCDLISKLATDPLKRDTFKRLADQLRLSAADIEKALSQARTSGI